MSRIFPSIFIPIEEVCYNFIIKGVGGFFMNLKSKYEIINC